MWWMMLIWMPSSWFAWFCYENSGRWWWWHFPKSENKWPNGDVADHWVTTTALPWPFFVCRDQRPSRTNKQLEINQWSWSLVVGLSICFPSSTVGPATPEMNPFSWRILINRQHSPPTVGKLRWLTGNMERFEDVIEPEDSVGPA